MVRIMRGRGKGEGLGTRLYPCRIPDGRNNTNKAMCMSNRII